MTRYAALALAAVLLAPAAARAAEHPEHPAKPKPAAKSKPASGGFVEDAATMKAFGDAVERYVKDAAADAGSFEAYDEKLDKTWELKLVRIHRDRVARLGGDKYFACADFKTADGKERALDLDFYASRTAEGWTVDEVLVHKLDGKERFVYDKDNRRVPVKEEKKKSAPAKAKGQLKKLPALQREPAGGGESGGGEQPAEGGSEHPEHPK